MGLLIETGYSTAQRALAWHMADPGSLSTPRSDLMQKQEAALGT